MTPRLDLPLICPVLIGRIPDLATLHRLMNRAKSGKGGVALLSGEAGMGKSRLVTESKTYAAAHEFLLLQGTCFPTDLSCPYAPLLDLLRSFFANRPGAKTETSLQQVAQVFLPLLPDVVPLFPEMAPASTPRPLDPGQEKRRLFEALAHFLTSQTAKHPVLLVVEDLHWSDDTSLEFLHYLARRCLAHRLLLLLTYRSEEVRPSLRHFLAHLDRERLAQEIVLAGLTPREVDAMLRAIFSLPRSAQLELADVLFPLTEGNPFFIEEILTSLVTAGEIFYVNGQWDRKELREVHIPRSVQDAVQQRTDRLSEDARQLVLLAAVAGRRFDFALLQELTHHDEQGLLLLLKELIAAQLVVEESTEQFAFRHALTREALYAQLLARERKALHRTVVETMERLSGSSLDAHVADLAYHSAEAGTWAKALEYGQRAGELAQRLYAPRAAVEQFTRALQAAQQGSLPPPATLYRLRGQAYETLGDFERARADYETALQKARLASDLPAAWQALMDLGFLWAERDYAQTGAYYQQALELAHDMSDPVILAHSLNRLGNWHVNSQQPAEGLHYHQEALTLFQQAHDPHGIAETCDLLGMAHYTEGDLLQGTTYYQQAVALFQQLDDRKGLTSSLSTLTGACGSYDYEMLVPAPMTFAEALSLGEQALKLAREIGQPSAEAYALCTLGQCLGPQGDYARALEVVQEGLAIAEQIGHHQWMTCGYWTLGALWLDLLALPEARASLEHALALAKEISSWYWIPLAAALLASVSVLQQDLTRAEALLTLGLGPDAPPQTAGERLVCCVRAELALARNKPALALDIIDRLITSTANLTDEQVIPRLWKVRGAALAALQRETEAEAALQAAQVTAHTRGLRPLLWRICLALGLLYQTQAREVAAEQAFSTAQAIIEHLAASVPDERVRQQFLSQTAHLLPQRRSPTPGRTVRQTRGGLTEREREVAVLIAQYQSNREIADLLVISERTVESHVSNIMFKLGFTSRKQIAVWAVENGLRATP